MTVVKVAEPVTNDQGQLLDEDGEVVDTSRKGKKDQIIAMEDQLYYLLHWGLTYEILIDRESRYPVSYTIAICQHTKTGEIKTFIPAEITVLGKEQK